MKLDYHIHTSRCCHATGTMEEYVAVAEKREMTEIGFSDHFPLELLGVVPENPVSMAAAELAGYIADVQRLQKQTSIPVKLGIEVDFVPGMEKEAAKLLAAYNFDYVIGSIHFLDEWDFTHPAHVKRYESMNIYELYERYFAVVRQLAQSGICQIVGHMDVVKKFAFFPRKAWDHLLIETCQAIKDADLCVEVNTAGWRAPVAEAYPGVFMLEKCLQLGIPVTLGSDAHRPQDVGGGIQRASFMLYKLGFREVASFAGGKRTMHPLLGESINL